MSFVPVIPKPFYDDIPLISGFRYSVKKFVFNESITFTIFLIDQHGKTLQVTEIIMDGEDYKNWSNDDDYVIKFISNKLYLILPTPENLLALAQNTSHSSFEWSGPVYNPPVVETPVVETPVVETPVVETPVVETPVVETPVE